MGFSSSHQEPGWRARVAEQRKLVLGSRQGCGAGLGAGIGEVWLGEGDFLQSHARSELCFYANHEHGLDTPAREARVP